MKHVISFVLRKVPRKYIQYIAHHILRMVGIFYYGNNVQCPIDGKTYRKFLPYGRLKSRPNALCPSSLSLERHRLMWLFLQQRTNLFTDRLKVLHIAPELCFIPHFEKLKNLDYITADLESPLAKVKMDVNDMPFDDDSFDVIFCNHVMEHMEDDYKAMREIKRVLKPGGWAIIQSPVYLWLDKTLEDPTITDPLERERVFEQNDHYRKYGKDYGDRLRKAGFKVTEDHFLDELSEEKRRRYALPEEEIIFLCEKI